MSHVKSLLVAVCFYAIALALVTRVLGDSPADGWLPLWIGAWTGWGYHTLFRGVPAATRWSDAWRATLLVWLWPVAARATGNASPGTPR